MNNQITPSIEIIPGSMSLSDLRQIFEGRVSVRFSADTANRVQACQIAVMDILNKGKPVYGVNTGFGKLAHVRIEKDQIAELQRRLIMSHSVGIGPLLEDDVVRLLLVLKANALAQGHSGIRWSVIELMLEMAMHDVLPAIPSKGSVGASGDLAPLSHMAAAMMGQGEMRVRGKPMPATEALATLGHEPITLGPKEGVALINGTQVSTALSLSGLFAAEDLLRAALVTGASMPAKAPQPRLMPVFTRCGARMASNALPLFIGDC